MRVTGLTLLCIILLHQVVFNQIAIVACGGFRVYLSSIHIDGRHLASGGLSVFLSVSYKLLEIAVGFHFRFIE